MPHIIQQALLTWANAILFCEGYCDAAGRVRPEKVAELFDRHGKFHAHILEKYQHLRPAILGVCDHIQIAPAGAIWM